VQRVYHTEAQIAIFIQTRMSGIILFQKEWIIKTYKNILKVHSMVFDNQKMEGAYTLADFLNILKKL
jgi:hypothetical protein